MINSDVKNSKDVTWNKNLSLVSEFYRENGHFNISVKDMPALWSWLNFQKNSYKNKTLRKDRVVSLKSIGLNLDFIPNKRKDFTEEEKLLAQICPLKTAEDTYLDVRWNISFSKLYFHWINTGNTIPPKTDKTFSNWCASQRFNFRNGTIRKDRKAFLDEIGFEWEGLNEKWLAKFNALVDFQDNHGHLMIPCRSKEYPDLAMFIKQQKSYKITGDLSASKIALLDSIGFIWVVGDIPERKHNLKEREEILKGKEKFSFKSKYLTPAQVLLIKKLSAQGLSIKKIIAKTKIKSFDKIHRIVNGNTYGNVK